MTLEQLRTELAGDAFVPGDDGYQGATTGFNLSLAHTPNVVVAAHTVNDVVRAVVFARETGMRVAMHSTGHGETPTTGGVMIAMSKLDAVYVNPISRLAVIGAGARWHHVVDAAARYGLMPVTGSSPTVGVVGFLLGGGLGPLARSHGFSSDYVTSCNVVTSGGEVLVANREMNAELFWALRGGKSGLGVVTEVSVRLVALKKLYAGSLMFDDEHIEPALRGWMRWTHTAHPQVTTSIAIVRFPDIDAIPAPLRGKRMMSLRFAFPGEKEFGAELAAPLRALAPASVDTIGEMSAKDMGQIHNDPTDARPAWIMGMMFDHADDDFASVMLEAFGAGSDAPFVAAELRHIGQATTSDVTEGTAVAGRSASYAFGGIAVNSQLFGSVVPTFAEQLTEKLKPWRAREGNPNFTGQSASHDAYLQLWPSDVRARLEAARAHYDPTGMFGGV